MVTECRVFVANSYVHILAAVALTGGHVESRIGVKEGWRGAEEQLQQS
jgi:hypothetical protein